ncbi:MAG: PAS domain S-box protein, partial [Bacteroidota bacterium]|nr:PAS domain S-box protein [Bacteroidota bacterium]
METKATKILAIDDNYDNLIVLNALLNESFPSAQLFTSQSGKKGIELCREHKPDVILLDIVMPVMDGYEVCRTLKNNTEFKNIPVVMVTAARTDRESRIKAIEAGADGFLTKPLDESEFIAQVKAMLRIKESEDRKLDEKERLEKLVKERTEALEAELQERRKAEQELNDSLTKLKKSKEVVMLLMRDLESEIEDRKRIEQSLNETNLKYAEAQRLAHIGNFEEDLRTNETKWSEEKYRIFGIPTGTPVKWKDVKRCISIEDQVRLDQALRNALKGSNHFSIVFKIIRPDGEFRYIKEENAVIKDQHGKPIRIVGTSQDITDLKLAENALKESEEHFQLLFNYAPIGYQSLDEKGFLIDVNNAWLEIFGYSKEEVIGKWFGDFLVPQFKDAFKERFLLFKKWGKVHSEFEMLKKDGTQIIVAFDGRIGHALSGEFKQTHCVLNDITEQRRNELELKESYDFTNSLLKTIPFGIDIVDKEGNILFQNENFKKYFGTDAIGKKCWEVYRDKKTQCENCPLKNKIKIGVTEVCESPGIHQSKTFEISHTGMMFKGEKAMLEIFQDVT